MVVRKQIHRLRFVTVLSLLLVLSVAPLAQAAQSSSPNYSVNEVYFGTGGVLNACSTSYCAKQSAGETAVGNTTSPNYQVHAGFNTDRYPSLTLVVNATTVNLGIQTAGTTSTATSNFSVKSYLTSGYVVQTVSPGLRAGSYTIANLATPTASSTTAEQFGINVVANTSPVALGANPVQVPSSAFGFGTAATGYNTANVYKYVNGDIIAQSLKSTGETDYTISYILNTTNVTPAGAYSMNQIIIATSTF